MRFLYPSDSRRAFIKGKGKLILYSLGSLFLFNVVLAPSLYAMPGGIGGGGMLVALLFMIGCTVGYFVCLIRSLLGVISKGPYRKVWIFFFSMFVLVGIVFICFIGGFMR